jgi:lipopolysaccharide transport system permease protein
MSKAVWRSRLLIWELFKRDFMSAYRKSFIGLTWIFIMPALGIVSWVFLQRTGIMNAGAVSVPYPVYVLIGSTMFGLFLSVYDASANTLESAKDLVMQIRYPHEALLFKQTAEQLANFSIGFLTNLLVLVVFRVWPSWGLLLLPLVMLPLVLMAMALGLVVSTINVVAVDISRFVRLALGLAMWITPVVYADTVESPVARTLIKWNPLTYAVCSCRDIILKGHLYHAKGYAIVAGMSVVLFLLAWRLFYVSEDKVIERMI